MEVDPPKDTPEVVITPSDEMSVEAAQDKAEPGKTRRGKRSASPTLEQVLFFCVSKIIINVQCNIQACHGHIVGSSYR